MTSRERVGRMFARKDHDRVPRFESCWLETLDRWMSEGLDAGDRTEAMEVVWNLLGRDLHMLCWFWPHPFPERKVVIEEDETTEVTLGPSGTIERFWKNKSGTPEHLGWECDSRDVWENTYKPAFLEQGVKIDIGEARRQLQTASSKQLWSYLAGVSAFEVLRKILGDEMFMMTLIDDPEWIADIAETATDNLLMNFQAVLDSGIQPDSIWIFDDMAFRTMTFCSPAHYRELIWPQHQRVADFAHANRMKLIFHSDGDLRGVLSHLIDAGVDCIQPMEAKASMDVRELAPQYGDRLGFFGNIDATKLITNDYDVIEHEIATKVAAGKAARAYMYHSDHSVPPQVSWDTYQHVIRMLDKYGNYG